MAGKKKHEIVGTSYKDGEGALNKVKHDLTNNMSDGQTFREIIPVEVDGKRILMFKIPASPRNIERPYGQPRHPVTR